MFLNINYISITMTSTSRASDVVAVSCNNESNNISLASGDVSMETNIIDVSRNVYDCEDEGQRHRVR